MRISRKIGISFFVTFLLVILLGALSIYSLSHIYKGLSQVFAKDLPASRFTYQIAISMEKVLSELNNFLITGNENFKISYENSYKAMRDDVVVVRKFISKEEEKSLFEEVVILGEDINGLAGDIFEKKTKIASLFKEIRRVEPEFTQRLSGLFDFEESKMKGEKDFLLIQAQNIPASLLIMEARSRLSSLLGELARYVSRQEDEISLSVMGDLLELEKSVKEYKNYYGYSLSDKERSFAAELISLSDEIKTGIESIVDIKKEMASGIESLLAKEKDFMKAIDDVISMKKSGISSKLGIGAALTEDIPAIHNISKLEKDIAESWRVSGRYILTDDKAYSDLYFQLRQSIDKGFKDYGRHARLRGTEGIFDEIVTSDSNILEAVNSSMEVFKEREAAIFELLSIETVIEKKIDDLLKSKDALIKETKAPQDILGELVPARWILMRLRSELSAASCLVSNYLAEQEAQYKDMYSEVYFNIKKYLSRYRSVSTSKGDSEFIEEIEPLLDEFNAKVLGVVDAHDRIAKERGWTLIKLEEGLKERLDKAVGVEILQIEKNKKDLTKKIAVINTVIFLIIGGVAIIAVLVILYTTNSITRPIQELYRGAEVIGRGDLDHRLNINTGDEIQDLADGFNKMAGELKELYTNLENKVKERTAQLAEANDALAVKNKELDDFTYIVSHDLKEPLRGVKAFTKLLIEDYSKKLDNEGKEHLHVISESSSRMTQLIEDLLNLSRIGRIRNIEPDVDMNEVLSDVKKNLAYSLEEKKVDLKIAGDFPKVECDRIRISEVFSNLISNAVKYSKKDVRPVIGVGYSEKHDLYEFYVKDNGIGIEEQYHDKVFQIFQRLHAKGGEYEGTGAGLTIVKKIVENHGGKIWVESKEGEGSTFYFTLPRKGIS